MESDAVKVTRADVPLELDELPILRISDVTITTEQISKAYTACALFTDNPDVPANLSDQQLQVFMKSLVTQISEATIKRMEDAKASTKQRSRDMDLSDALPEPDA